MVMDEWYEEEPFDFDDDLWWEPDNPEDEMTIKGVARDSKIAKRRHGMRVDGRSVFVIQQSQQKRDKRKGDTK